MIMTKERRVESTRTSVKGFAILLTELIKNKYKFELFSTI